MNRSDKEIFYNGSGCYDPTAGTAIARLEAEIIKRRREQKQQKQQKLADEACRKAAKSAA